MGEIGVIVIPAMIFDGDEPAPFGFEPPVVTDPASSKQRTCVDDPARLAVGNNKSRSVQAQGRITTGPDVVRKNSGETALRAVAGIVEVARVEIAAIIKRPATCARSAAGASRRASGSQSNGTTPACLSSAQIFPQQTWCCAHGRPADTASDTSGWGRTVWDEGAWAKTAYMYRTLQVD
jgi:hypothetical protein